MTVSLHVLVARQPKAPAHDADDRLAHASQLRLTWWRFRGHRLAVVSLFVIVLFYVVVALADLLAVADPQATDARRSYMPP
jgi:peptide/nickel transport system permease protein